MMGPSAGYAAGQRALQRGASCALSDHFHITIGEEGEMIYVFLNLLRGMTWLEAAYYGCAHPGNFPCGDPLWAPYRTTNYS